MTAGEKLLRDISSNHVVMGLFGAWEILSHLKIDKQNTPKSCTNVQYERGVDKLYDTRQNELPCHKISLAMTTLA
jgi:hypothetical protein